jgi:branched-chain amino acid transport system permease protein
LEIMTTVLEGILLGSIYGLAASGLSFVFGVMMIINVAHAEFIMLGSFITFGLWFFFKIDPLLSIFLSVAAVYVFCIFLYRTIIRKVLGKMNLVSLILCFGISIFLWNFAQVFFSSTFRSVPYSTGSVGFLGAFFSVNKIISFSIVTAIIVALHLFLKFTRMGKAIRAVSQNPAVADISGINVDRVRMIGFGIGGGLAAVAGSLISIQWSIYPLMGQDLILKCFSIVAIGGLGSIPGAFLGGIVLGVAETIGTQYWDSTMANVIAPLLLILTFLFRPQGFFGVEERVD